MENGAARHWDKSVKEGGAVWSAAATHSRDPFSKFPHWILDHLPDEGTVADIGCGYGRIAIPVLKTKPRLNYIGFDASAEMLSKFQMIAADAAVACTTRQCEFPPIPLDSNSIDAAISCSVLLHNPYKAAREIVAEIHRVLKPGGVAIFAGSFPARWNLEGIQNFVAQGLIPSLRRKNGPVRTYTRFLVRDVLAEFASVNLFVERATVFPRSLWRWQLPFGGIIRAVNDAAERRTWSRELFARGFEVIARK
jgi:SAM-dependent methyltransferase